MKFFTFLFYAFAIFPIIWECMIISSPIKMSEKLQAMKKTKADKWNPTQYTAAVFFLCYAIWAILGLLSTQWIVFALVLALSIIPKGKFVFSRWLDAVLSLPILVFIVINKYHLHLDLLEFIKQI